MDDKGEGKPPRPLDEDERRWLRRLERCLRDMPSRLWLVESGDVLILVDRKAALDVELHDGRASHPRVFLADVCHGFGKVTGVSG